MSLCFNSDFAYIPRAGALLAIDIYMYFNIKYVGLVAKYPKKRLNICVLICFVIYLVAWTQIIQKDAVTFKMVPWGYWYISFVFRSECLPVGDSLAHPRMAILCDAAASRPAVHGNGHRCVLHGQQCRSGS